MRIISSSLFKVLKVFIIAPLIALPACIDYLDTRPENQMLLEEFWQKESDVEAVVLTCYRTMQEDDFIRRVITWGELRSDNVITSGSAGADEQNASNANILANNGLCRWTIFYKVINYCNTVLKYAPEVVGKDPDFTAADLQAKSAEALAIRALCYFYLVRTFRDVPLSLDATISDEQTLQIPQASPDTILTKITEELRQAEQWALSEYLRESESKGRMTKDAIRALLADIYLWQGKYAECIEYCDKLINATLVTTGTSITMPKYRLEEEMPSEAIFGRGNSSESIFELQFSTEKYNEGVGELYGRASDPNGQLAATVVYAENETVFPATDERKADFIVSTKTESGAYPIFKYMGSRMGVGSTNMYAYNSTTANWIFYRITDVMLMKAEALVQLQRSDDDLKEALHIVNTTYMRANPTLLETDTLSFENYGNVTAMEQLLLLERQRELMFEGKRWFDLLRHSIRKNSSEDLVNYLMNKYTANLSTIAAKLSVMNALYLPVHADELKVNPLLKQNPYYQTSSNIEK
jgi:tetratricopeptide (TPR) repeat protein